MAAIMVTRKVAIKISLNRHICQITTWATIKGACIANSLIMREVATIVATMELAADTSNLMETIPIMAMEV